MSENDVTQRKRSVRGKRQIKNHRFLKILGLVVGILVFTGVAVAAFVTYRAARSVSSISRAEDALPTGSRPPVATPSANKAAPMNILMIGSDTRNPDETGRSDSFIVLHLSGDRTKAYLVSFPRDMWVNVPGHGQAKINAAYSWGGSALAISTIEQLTNARIDHIVTTDFQGFSGLVDAVGGVTVQNPVAFVGKDSATGNYYNWPKGPVKLDGPSALAFSRQRYQLPRGDLDRALRQRALVKALTLKVASPQVLANPATLTSVIGTVSKYVTLDAEFTDATIYGLAASMRVTSGDQVDMLQAPITGFGRSADGQSIDVVDVAGMTALGKALSTDTMADYVAAHPK